MGRARGTEIRPSAEPQSPAVASDPPPRYLGKQGLGGLQHKEVVVEETPNH